MSSSSINMKGSLPLLILHVLSLGTNHGYQIAKQIKEESEGILDFKEGTLYPTLHSLEKQKLIVSDMQKVNGRKRRYYQITDSGRAALAEQSQEWTAFAGAVNRILQGNEA